MSSCSAIVHPIYCVNENCLCLNFGEGWTCASKSKIFLLIFFYFFLTDLDWIYIHQNEIKATLTNSWLFQKTNQVCFWLWCCRHKFFFLQTTGTPPIQFKWHVYTKQKKIHANIRALIVIWDILAKPCIGPMHRILFAKIYWCLYKSLSNWWLSKMKDETKVMSHFKVMDFYGCDYWEF